MISLLSGIDAFMTLIPVTVKDVDFGGKADVCPDAAGQRGIFSFRNIIVFFVIFAIQFLFPEDGFGLLFGRFFWGFFG